MLVCCVLIVFCCSGKGKKKSCYHGKMHTIWYKSRILSQLPALCYSHMLNKVRCLIISLERVADVCLPISCVLEIKVAHVIYCLLSFLSIQGWSCVIDNSSKAALHTSVCTRTRNNNILHDAISFEICKLFRYPQRKN